MLFVSSSILVSCDSKSDVRDAAKDSLNPEAAAMTATATDPTAMPSETPSGPTTTVNFSEERFNFGTVTAGEKVQHNFKIKNTGKEPLIITNASSSCGCTSCSSWSSCSGSSCTSSCCSSWYLTT